MPKINVYLPDDLAEALRGRSDNINVSAACQQALWQEVQRMEAVELGRPAFEELEVQTGEDRHRTERFMGRWVIEPDDDMRSGDPGADAGTCWGVAQTAKGRIAVYAYHVNDRWPARLEVFNSFEEACSQLLPSDIAEEYQARQGGDIWRDI